jgi:hypothetical protein
LCHELRITTVDEVESLTRMAYPDEQPSSRGLALARDVLSAAED